MVTVVISCFPWSWKTTRLATLWIAGFASFYLLMKGTLLGLPTVTTDQWGGLALTLFLFASVVLIGMPMGLGLALMRRSELPIVRLLASLLIDFIRSLPLLTTLFTAAVVFPLLLPDWLQGDKIWRVIIIGFFDVLASANAAFGTGEWSPYYMEVYAFVADIYWLFIFSLGQNGEYLGKRMAVAQR